MFGSSVSAPCSPMHLHPPPLDNEVLPMRFLPLTLISLSAFGATFASASTFPDGSYTLSATTFTSGVPYRQRSGHPHRHPDLRRGRHAHPPPISPSTTPPPEPPSLSPTLGQPSSTPTSICRAPTSTTPPIPVSTTSSASRTQPPTDPSASPVASIATPSP